MVEVFSKPNELVLMYINYSLEVAKACSLNAFARFGVPSEIRVDRGTEFAWHLSTLRSDLGISRHTIST